MIVKSQSDENWRGFAQKWTWHLKFSHALRTQQHNKTHLLEILLIFHCGCIVVKVFVVVMNIKITIP